jgi:hypothetical protein
MINFASDNNGEVLLAALAMQSVRHQRSLDRTGGLNIRGAPYNLMRQGKIERWHLTLKNRILRENYYLPGELEARIEAFVATTITCATAFLHATASIYTIMPTRFLPGVSSGCLCHAGT